MATLKIRKASDIAAVIKAVREDAGLTQTELAERLVFSRDYMVDIESGKETLYVTRLFRVLHELGIGMTLDYGDGHDQS
ncbi:MAG: helix-turn-helix domain-containing protein [Propionibacteriaceae bacterium]|nr:helix-turn-helix domain-containing protein [Propionibacteriaceae bacterium]